MVKVRKNLTGERFGKWIVIKQTEDYIRPDGRHSSQWLCRCDCGTEKAVKGDSLTCGHSQSCGCLISVKAKENFKKSNTYDLSGEYGIGYTSKGESFYFDLEDYDKIKKYCWNINRKDGYVSTDIYNSKTKEKYKLQLHRLIMNCPNNMVVDHKNGNQTRNDNRKSNLRICTNQENVMNSGIAKNNKSGVTGVFWNKNKNKWQAAIKYNYKSILLGRFNNFEDAVQARKEAEKKYFGEYAYKESNQNQFYN